MALNINMELFSIVQLGIGFLFIFSAFNTQSYLEEIVLDSLSHSNSTDAPKIDAKAGFNSLAIIYGFLTPANLIAPAIIGLVAPKWAMAMGAACYGLFMFPFVLPMIFEPVLYLTSAILGTGGAILWTGQGVYLTRVSSQDTIGRNSGITWALLQGNGLIGSVLIYFMLKEHDHHNDEGGDNEGSSHSLSSTTIRSIYGAFTGLVGLGVLTLALLPRPQTTEPSNELQSIIGENDFHESYSAENPAVVDSVTLETPEEKERKAKRAETFGVRARNLFYQCWLDFKKTIKMALTKDMLLLSVVFFYTGIETAFWTGVYPVTLGFTSGFDMPKNEILAFNAAFVAIGQITGGGAFGLFGERTNKFGRSPIIILGVIGHMVAFFCTFYNIPDNATKGPTDSIGYWQPNIYLAIFVSFLLGFSDSCWQTQIYSILGSMYSEDSAPAFALFKLIQSLAACMGFVYAKILLRWQLLIMIINCFLASIAFFPVEFTAQQRLLTSRSHEA